MSCVCASNRSLHNLSDLNAWSYGCQASPSRICQKEKTSECKILIKRWIAKSSIHAQSICRVIIVRLYPRQLLSVVRLLVIYDICVYKRAFMENDYRLQSITHGNRLLKWWNDMRIDWQRIIRCMIFIREWVSKLYQLIRKILVLMIS